MLQPAEGRYKVYILDEAHQLTDAAWNALLKLIEEPPPHLVFVFCTTDLSKVLPTVRSRCQTFVFARPRLPELVRQLRRDRRRREDRRARRGALADRARGARLLPRRRLDARPALGRRREERSPCRPCSSCSARSRRRRSSGSRPRRRPRHRRRAHVRRGAVRAGPGSRPPRHRPARAPAPPPARPAHGRGPRLAAGDRGDARAAARAGEPARRGDRAAADRPARRRGRGPAPGRRPTPPARARARQGDAARARTSRASRSPTGSSSSSSADTSPSAARPGARHRGTARDADGRSGRAPPAPAAAVARARAAPGGVAAHDPARRRGALDPDGVDAARGASAALADDTLTVEFPASAAFHRQLAEDPKNATLLEEALYEVTGRRLALAFSSASTPRRRTRSRRRGRDPRAGEGDLRRPRAQRWNND